MTAELTTWRKMISYCLECDGESWNDVVAMTLTDEELDREFDSGYGGHRGCSFTLWTASRVYFPCTYDGSEWCDSVPRNPCNTKTQHIGGE